MISILFFLLGHLSWVQLIRLSNPAAEPIIEHDHAAISITEPIHTMAWRNGETCASGNRHMPVLFSVQHGSFFDELITSQALVTYKTTRWSQQANVNARCRRNGCGLDGRVRKRTRHRNVHTVTVMAPDASRRPEGAG